MPEKNETNKVRLIGEVISEFTFNHSEKSGGNGKTRPITARFAH